MQWGDHPGGPVVRTGPNLPLQGARAQSLVEGKIPQVMQGSQKKSKNAVEVLFLNKPSTQYSDC